MGDSTEAARQLVETASFPWYQRFRLAGGVYTPGQRDVEWIVQRCQIPDDLSGLAVLDIGATNGGVSFEMERRGASRVVAVDIYPPSEFGFDQLKELLGSNVEFVQARVYDLAEVFDEQFDLVFMLGVLYHLRHPLLALDNVHAVTRGDVLLETEVADDEVANDSELAIARFFRGDERAGDSSNWFAPNIQCLLDWCQSCGLESKFLEAWPDPDPSRCLLRLTCSGGGPEYRRVSYETPIRVVPHQW